MRNWSAVKWQQNELTPQSVIDYTYLKIKSCEKITKLFNISNSENHGHQKFWGEWISLEKRNSKWYFGIDFDWANAKYRKPTQKGNRAQVWTPAPIKPIMFLHQLGLRWFLILSWFTLAGKRMALIYSHITLSTQSV